MHLNLGSLDLLAAALRAAAEAEAEYAGPTLEGTIDGDGSSNVSTAEIYVDIHTRAADTTLFAIACGRAVDASAYISGIDWGSEAVGWTALTEIDSHQGGQANDTVFFAGQLPEASGTTGLDDIRVNGSGNGCRDWTVIVFSLAGVNQSTPTGDTDKVTESAEAVAGLDGSITTTAANSFCCAVSGLSAAALHTWTAGSGTEGAEQVSDAGTGTSTVSSSMAWLPVIDSGTDYEPDYSIFDISDGTTPITEDDQALFVFEVLAA